MGVGVGVGAAGACHIHFRALRLSAASRPSEAAWAKITGGGAVGAWTRNRSEGLAPRAPSVGEPGASEKRTVDVVSSRQKSSMSSPGTRPNAALATKTTGGAGGTTFTRMSAGVAPIAASVGEPGASEK